MFLRTLTGAHVYRTQQSPICQEVYLRLKLEGKTLRDIKDLSLEASCWVRKPTFNHARKLLCLRLSNPVHMSFTSQRLMPYCIFSSFLTTTTLIFPWKSKRRPPLLSLKIQNVEFMEAPSFVRSLLRLLRRRSKPSSQLFIPTELKFGTFIFVFT
jgi:hypothetical protein